MKKINQIRKKLREISRIDKKLADQLSAAQLTKLQNERKTLIQELKDLIDTS